MSPTVSRIMLSFAMVFAAIVGYPLVALVLSEVFPTGFYYRPWLFYVAPLAFTTAFTTGWLLIWAPQVSWSRKRVGATVNALLSAFAIAVAMYGAMLMVENRVGFEGVVLGMFTWLTLWIALTAIVWRDSVGEQVKRWSRVTVSVVQCQTCGYDMAGLRDPTCLECGRSYTLDELLVGSARGRTDVE